jgi:hypothetical protein
MALKGTLTDFGIADILQLIGQQQKTGTLHLRSEQEEVRVVFREGSIVSAFKYLGKKRDPLGAALVRAGILTDLELEQATQAQRKNSTRLEEILLVENLVTEMQLRRTMQRQTTETLYKLFEWKTGKYEFKQGETKSGGLELTPLRVEAVVMEGFRRIDEWPAIRRLIPSDEVTFEKLGVLKAERAGDGEDNDTSLTPERVVFGLIGPERSARHLADITGLGTFETFQALANLIKSGTLRVARASEALVEVPRGRLTVKTGLGTYLVYFCFAVSIVALGGWTGKKMNAPKRPPASTYSDPATQRLLSQAQLARIAAAVALFRLENGEVPEALGALVAKGLLTADDLKYPWCEAYYYRKTSPLEFVLLPPLR